MRARRRPRVCRCGPTRVIRCASVPAYRLLWADAVAQKRPILPIPSPAPRTSARRRTHTRSPPYRTLSRHAPPISHLRHFTSQFIVHISLSSTSTLASSHSHIAAHVTLTSHVSPISNAYSGISFAHLDYTSRHPPSYHINKFLIVVHQPTCITYTITCFTIIIIRVCERCSRCQPVACGCGSGPQPSGRPSARSPRAGR